MVELMVVVMVVAILVAAAWPVYRFAVRKAYLSEAKASLAAIRSAELVYHTEHQAFLAVAEGDIENDPTDVDNSGLGVIVTNNSWFNSPNYFKVEAGNSSIETSFIVTADGSKRTLDPNPVADIKVTLTHDGQWGP